MNFVKSTVLSLSLLCSCTGTWTLQENNDYFKPSGNNDEHFTQGLRLSRRTIDEGGSDVYYLGQHLYTPQDKTTREPILTDRPYAAYLYGGYERHNIVTPNQEINYGLTVGMIGPAALGEQAQNNVHKWIGSKHVYGWDNQLHNELGVIGTVEGREQLRLFSSSDIISRAGINAGNVFTQAYAGSTLRIGVGLDSLIDSSSPVFPRGVHSPYSAYIFAGTLGRAVARNIFLDGNTFRNSQSIDKEPMVGEVNIGLSLKYEGYGITYTYVKQSSEYEGDEGSSFGEIKFEWSYDAGP